MDVAEKKIENWTLELNKKIIYEAQPRQNYFHESEADETLYGGSAGGGKTKAIIGDAIAFCVENPKVRVAIFRRTYPELEKSIIYEFRNTLPFWSYKYNDSKKTAIFSNQSIIEFNYCESEKDVYRYQSAEYDRIYFDELTHFTEFQYKYLLSRLRTTKKDIFPQVKSGTNPGNIGHAWVKKRFISGAKPEQQIERFDKETKTRFTTIFIPAKVWDNKYIIDNDPGYIDKLKRLPEDERRALLEGDWEVFAGQYFKEWRSDLHIIDYFDYDLEDCKKIVTFDWGYASWGTAIWLAVCPENKFGVQRVYQYREISQRKRNPEGWAEDMLVFFKIESIEFLVLPHDCFASEYGQRSIAETFKYIFNKNKMKINIVSGDTLTKGARLNRAAMTHQNLALADDGKPYLQIHRKCSKTIENLPMLIHDKNNPEDVEKCDIDHWYDALSMGLVKIYRTWKINSSPTKRTKKIYLGRKTLPIDRKTGEYITPPLEKIFERIKHKKVRKSLE